MNHTWIIYTYGNQDTLYNILMSTGAFFGGSALSGMIKLAVATAVIVALTQITGVISTGQGGRPFEYAFFFRFYLLYAIFVMIPANNIVIQDEMTGQPLVIATSSTNRIPLGVIAINSFTSTVVHGFVNIFEQYFITGSSGNPALSYSKSGMAFGANFLAGLPTMTTGDSDFETNLANYFSNCGLPIAYSQGAMNSLAGETDILGFFMNNFQDIQSQRFVSQVTNGNQTISTCADAIKSLNQTWNTNSQQYLNHVAHIVGFPNAIATNFITAANMTSNDLLQVTNGASDALKQSMAMNLIYKSIYNTSAQVDNSSLAHAAYDAQQFQQYQAGGVLSSDQAARVVPALKNFAEAMLFMLYPIMVFYALITTNIGVVIKYIKFSATIATIPLVYEIISALIFWYTSEKTGGIISEGGFNLLSASGLYNLNSSIAATANYLAMSTPVLAYAIVSGSDQAITSVFSHATAPAGSVSASAGSEEAKGNMNIGNTSIDNSSMNNMAANKFNNAMDLTSGTSQLNDRQNSSTISSYKDGSSTIQTSISSGAVTDQTNQALQQQLSQSFGQAISATKQTGEDLSNSYKAAATYAQSHGLSSSGSHDKGTGVEVKDGVSVTGSNTHQTAGEISGGGSIGMGSSGGGSSGAATAGISAKDSHATVDEYGINKSTIVTDTNSWKHSDLYSSDQTFKSMVDHTEAAQHRYSENYTKTQDLKEQLQTAQSTTVSQQMNNNQGSWQDAITRHTKNGITDYAAAAKDFNSPSARTGDFNNNKQVAIGQTEVHSGQYAGFTKQFNSDFEKQRQNLGSNTGSSVDQALKNGENTVVNQSNQGISEAGAHTRGHKVTTVDHTNADGPKYGGDVIVNTVDNLQKNAHNLVEKNGVSPNSSGYPTINKTSK